MELTKGETALLSEEFEYKYRVNNTEKTKDGRYADAQIQDCWCAFILGARAFKNLDPADVKTRNEEA